MDVWNKSPKAGKTTQQNLSVSNLPKSFESTLPDGTIDIYDKIELPSILVVTSKGQYIYKPQTYVSRKTMSVITHNGKGGWSGYSKTKDGKNYSINSLTNKVNLDTFSVDNTCVEVLDTSKKDTKNITIKKSRTIQDIQFGNSDFYNRLKPINKICDLYIEVSYRSYQLFGSNETETINYVSNLFLSIKNLYAREGIYFRLRKVYINTNQDLYTITSIQNTLEIFRQRSNSNTPVNTESHFKMLLDINQNAGGIGNLGANNSANGYETTSPQIYPTTCHSVLNIGSTQNLLQLSQNPVGTSNYNLPIVAAVHELGHNLGSRHTHWCGWKDDQNNPIGVLDSCSNGETIANQSCDNINIPYGSWNSSIMSYCHLVKSVFTLPPVDPTKWEYSYDGPGQFFTYRSTKNMLVRGFWKYPRHAIRSNLYLSDQLPFVDFTTKPTTTTYPTVINVTRTTAGSGGVVSDTGNAPFLVRGLIWSTTLDPTIENCLDFEIADYGQLGSFNIMMKNLEPGSTYYVRSFATNLAGVSYGQSIQFTTTSPQEPIISTALYESTNTSIISGGFSINTYGSSVLERGVIYSTSQNNITYDLTTKVFDPNNNTANFILSLDNLIPSTNYFFRAFVKTSGGIGYGQVRSLTTQSSSQIIFKPIQSIRILSTKSKFGVGGTSTLAFLSDGGSPIIRRGFCWSTNSSPTLNDQYLEIGQGMGSFNGIIRDLSQQTQYFIRIFAENSQGVFYSDEISFTTKKLVFYLTGIVPTVTGAMSTTFIDTDEVPWQNGIVASKTTPNVTIVNSNATNLTGDGFPQTPFIGTRDVSIPLNPSNLLPGQTVYVRPVIIDDFREYNYGDAMPFVYPDRPVVQANGASASSPTTVSFGATVVSDGGSPIIERGVLYKSGTIPSYTDPSTTKITTPGQLGSFGVSVTNLTPGTTYFFSAFAKNQNNFVGGSILYIIATPLQLPVVFTNPIVQNITQNSATVSGQVLNRWGKTITNMGIVFSTQPSFNPSIIRTYSPPTDNSFNMIITGLQPNTTYYFYAYATTSDGQGKGEVQSFTTSSVTSPTLTTTTISNLTYNSATSGGNILSNGFSNITQTGVCWSTSPNPTIDLTTKTTNGPNSTSFISNLSGLEPLQTYFIRSYATNSVGTGYGNELSFTTPPSPFPVVLTSNSAATTSTTASSGGEITNQGDAPVTQRGVIWSTTFDNLTIALPTKTSNGIGVGQFTSSITGLNPNTTYYIKAYAKNSIGVGYGNLVGVTTPQSGDKQCAISEMSVSQGPTAGGVRWFSQFNLNINCQSYKVDVSRYTSDPTNNPNLTPVQTYVINNANPYTPSITDLNNGYVRLLMKPQPFGDPVNGTWYSLNVKCNGTCSSNPITKQYFYIPPP